MSTENLKNAILEFQASFQQSQPFKHQAAAVLNRMSINSSNTYKELKPGSWRSTPAGYSLKGDGPSVVSMSSISALRRQKL